MRITGGEWRGRKFHIPKSQQVRPATEQQRESVFNMLRSLIPLENIAVLDLFAGSGSFGLEALSRGAAFALFVEKDPRFARVLKETLRLFGAEDRAKVVTMNVRRFIQLPRVQFSLSPFHLVFYDPPYAESYGDIFPSLFRSHYVIEGSVIVLKRSVRSSPLLVAGCSQYRVRKYGDTAIEIWIVEEMKVRDYEGENRRLSGNI